MTHAELVELGYKWLLKNGCGLAFREFKAQTPTGEEPDAIGFGQRHSILLECKATRADFHADKRKLFRQRPSLGMGKYRFYLCPKDVIKPEDLPANWGLLYASGNRIRTVHNPYRDGNKWRGGFAQNETAERALLFTALRRIHLRGLLDTIYEPYG